MRFFSFPNANRLLTPLKHALIAPVVALLGIAASRMRFEYLFVSLKPCAGV
jgi:hypothetical protein